MSNRFLTQAEFTAGLKSAAEAQIAKMPVEEIEKLAATDFPDGMRSGIRNGLLILLVIVAREYLKARASDGAVEPIQAPSEGTAGKPDCSNEKDLP